MALDEFIWEQKYRPKTVDECILPESIKTEVKDFINKGQIPNFLFSGGPGMGKTTLAKAVANELKADLLYVNGSKDNGIDVLRTTIQQFVSTVSFGGGVKIVLIDEAEYLNPNSVQPALRAFLEEHSANARFIFTCNYKNRIIEPLHSRFNIVDFKISAEDKSQLAGQFFKRVVGILQAEGVEFDKKVVAELITKNFPDFRKTLITLQSYSSSGKIDAGILLNLGDENYKELTSYLKEKAFSDVRKWVGKNIDSGATEIMDKLYERCSDIMEPKSIPNLILILAQYSYQSAFVANQELNLMAAMTEVMGSCQFK